MRKKGKELEEEGGKGEEVGEEENEGIDEVNATSYICYRYNSV